MSEVFERYERQYCELSANLLRKCNAAGALDGGNFNTQTSLISLNCYLLFTARYSCAVTPIPVISYTYLISLSFVMNSFPEPMLPVVTLLELVM